MKRAEPVRGQFRTSAGAAFASQQPRSQQPSKPRRTAELAAVSRIVEAWQVALRLPVVTLAVSAPHADGTVSVR